MKTDIIRTSVYLPRTLHERAKKMKINISALLKETLESEIYQDEPNFITKKIQELDKSHEKNRDNLLAKLRVAEEKQETRRKEFSQVDYQLEDRDAWLPKRKVKDNSSGGE